MKKTTTDVGVIVGRFQVHELHEAHRSLIDLVRKEVDRVIIFVGLSPLRNTQRNPLDFRERRKMIQDVYPDIDVYYIDDNRDDRVWSDDLDRQIAKWTKPSQTVILYGSRDSFIPHYYGTHPTKELDAEKFISGTEIRKRISANYPMTPAYRAGVIAATFNRYPTSFTTVDVAIFDGERLLLARKPKEKGLRFIGGFASPDSPSFEADARREVYEEAGGIEITTPEYVGSTLVDDWRYRSETDKIKTILFKANFVSGRPVGGDDVESVEWVDFSTLTEDQMVPEHRPLLRMLD
jgi:bifunctional NMN adenylyltransferase/nudix hydrolase